MANDSTLPKRIVLFGLLLVSCFSFIEATVRKNKLKTLHISHELKKSRIHRSPITVTADFVAKSSNLETFGRFGRSVQGSPQVDSHSITAFQLNDSHNQMIVHWAGAGSDVILALSKQSHPRNSTNVTSNLFISYDYGRTFVNKNNQLRLPSGGESLIDHYFSSKVHNSHYVFTDVVHNYIFTTEDYGQTIYPRFVPFSPKTISLHPVEPEKILGMDEDDEDKKLYISHNFGRSWNLMQSGVKSFYLGNPLYDHQHDIFVERLQPDGRSTIVRSSQYFQGDIETLLYDAEDFEIQDAYMFATKKVEHMIDKRSPLNSTERFHLELYVSHRRGPFHSARFPHTYDHTDYYVADASEEMVFMCVTHDNNITNLYISNNNGSKYSLSLPNIVYYNPEANNKNSWLMFFADEAFADISKVDGLRGVYFASQLLRNDSNLMRQESQRTLVTFDKGGEWSPVMAPQFDNQGHPTNCSRWMNCSLHLAQKFSRLYPGSRAMQIYSRANAPGLILATGTLGQNMKAGGDMYISSDAGYTWRQALDGRNFYAIGDHGGLIVAVSEFGSTNEILYSFNEGETFKSMLFHEEKIYVYGVLTEPGEQTATFTLFGSHTTKHQWVIVQVNLSTVFEVPCVDSDYKMWSFTDNPPFAGCILGKKTEYERRIPHAKCFNGRTYEREIVVKNCSCTREDFDCDFGFTMNSSTPWIQNCVQDPTIIISLNEIPKPCPPGTFYQFTRGYQKIPSDTCVGGAESRYAPLLYSCPITEVPEFILYSTRNEIFRYVLSEGGIRQQIYSRPDTSEHHSIFAVDFEYEYNCVIFSDGFDNSIKRLCLGDKDNTVETIITHGANSVESLAYDWDGENIFWIETSAKELYVAKRNGFYQRLLFNTTHMDNPRALALNPNKGWMYWTDWSMVNPRIVRAWMNGNQSSYQVLVQGKSNVYWPNGLTIDHRFEMMYWTDAHLDRIMKASLTGENLEIIASGGDVIHPYAIGMYKSVLYWTDWSMRAIMYSDTRPGNRGVHVLVHNVSNIMDLKVVSFQTQKLETACFGNMGRLCSQLCLPRPSMGDSNKQNRTCMCGDSFLVSKIPSKADEHCICPPGEILNQTFGYCEPDHGRNNCSADQFLCQNGKCISASWICDRDNDCGDMSDEMDCSLEACPQGNIRCKTMNRCIPARWRCDFDYDCEDKSDEEGCDYPQCSSTEFRCNTGRCINNRWKCDGDDDCHDGSSNTTSTDERNCNFTRSCVDSEFRCTGGTPPCVAAEHRCDGTPHCSDLSDETNCTGIKCSVREFACHSGNQCIFQTWVCDGAKDCQDNSDEVSCSTTSPAATGPTPTARTNCLISEYRCLNRRCISLSRICDNINDCGDFSDEMFCGARNVTSSPCRPSEFMCQSGSCIASDLRCDGHSDCVDGSDEYSCRTTTEMPSECKESMFQCKNGFCISKSWVCDKVADCIDGDDELHCQGAVDCPSDKFKCEFSEGCISKTQVCDGRIDCPDISDESSCSTTPAPTRTVTACSQSEFTCLLTGQCIPWIRQCDSEYCPEDPNNRVCYGVLYSWYLSLGTRSDTTMNIRWNLSKGNNSRHNIDHFLLSYIGVHHDTDDLSSYRNLTVNNQHDITIRSLDPNHQYSIRLYGNVSGTWVALTRALDFWTFEGLPSQPTFVQQTQKNDHITLTWRPPQRVYSKIIQYNIYVENAKYPPTKVFEYDVKHMPSKSNYTYDVPLANGFYYIQIAAVSAIGVGEKSPKFNVTLKLYEPLANASVTHLAAVPVMYGIKLNWMAPAVSSISLQSLQYKILYTDDYGVGVNVTVNTTFYEVTLLCPGTQYDFTVQPVSGSSRGLVSVVAGSPKGKKEDLAIKNVRKLSMENGSYAIMWDKPVGDKNNFEYMIFFDNHHHHDFFEQKADNRSTKDNKLVLSDVDSCEIYTVKVALEKPARCFPSASTTFRSQYDIRSRPKELQAVVVNRTSAEVTWMSPCANDPSIDAYMVRVKEVRFRKPKNFFSKQSNLSLSNLYRGALYEVAVRTNEEQASFSKTIDIQIDPYAPPKNLFYTLTENDDKMRVMWENSTDMPLDDEYKGYNVYRWKQSQENSCNTYNISMKPWKANVLENYVSVTVDDTYNYCFSVGLTAVHGYRGSMYKPLFLPREISSGLTPHSLTTLSKTNMIAIFVSVSVVVIILVVLLGVFIIRHRRLQRSFLSFANSHYDSRSGTTTFSAANDLGDDEDSPMITGFSDDEPMVIG